ncbi:CDP-glycerol glycerophosphotransferase family protein [Actinobacillus pleuropneumoniae]|uniref:Glycerophosphotransferase n=2 Tax=Actinobacillus pleuropneumoniae TaxID=715 RepID=B3GYR3_ACTP7|nr:CDP-glycerol glycerophosphotransferase family protein [Actinobacillus pleuropneumoniae]ACE62294.1 Glycerophosphotransferase [Actinobacillus pleuropneumoniae serovar 7 str. AP76]EFN02190.1 Cps2A [Actinobacillus pleuropneumoniae serovar 13 str. N273]EFM93519.1 Cps2A [Actinobacillus pleuropneumoniae serovar 9 str. CVJ13261]EFM97843.1 Cps2A [Actinobacillus pleuropneumoniae serovar 11 str. 56153]MEE3670340.1 CDP-glycerol glycerophosphotransferase family protein [Actinobacillus pleuropneumoniae]
MLMKIAFIAWNSFQVLHFKPLLQALPCALLIIEKRRRSVPICKDILRDINNNIAYIRHTDIYAKIDGNFDVLVAQTTFEQLYLFHRTKIALLQYGYAKEPYNYGTWRAFADLNLVYGNYAYERISYFSPTKITGCPRYDLWYQPLFHQKAKENYARVLDTSKKTIVYAPSWGELSSFKLYIEEITKLSLFYNVLVKLHHNTLLLANKHQNYEKLYPNLHFFYEGEDLLSLISVADIVISDFSGAIFDAIFCKKTVVLLSISLVNQPKLDKFSLEIAYRSKLGYEVFSPDQVAITVARALTEPKLVDETLYQQLFMHNKDATQQVINALQQLAEGKYTLSQQQLYVRQTEKLLNIEKIKQQKNKKQSFNKIRQISKRLIKK